MGHLRTTLLQGNLSRLKNEDKDNPKNSLVGIRGGYTHLGPEHTQHGYNHSSERGGGLRVARYRERVVECPLTCV